MPDAAQLQADAQTVKELADKGDPAVTPVLNAEAYLCAARCYLETQQKDLASDLIDQAIALDIHDKTKQEYRIFEETYLQNGTP